MMTQLGHAIDLIPNLSPNVEDDLLRCLAREVEIYSTNISGTKCLLCPFRVLSRSFYLRRHLAYHCKENMYVADIRSPQLNVIRAIFDQRLITFPLLNEGIITPDLLQISASLIAKWNATCSAVIAKQLRSVNRPILVRVLTHNRSEY